MSFSLKRWFSRSIADGPDAVGPPTPRPVRRKSTLILLAGTLALIGAISSAYYFAMRPVTLRIAVGPPNSDDVKVVQALVQAFARQHGSVRLRPVLTEDAGASATALADGKSDFAIIRGDIDVPKNAQAVATLRKNVAVLWVPARAKSKKSARITRITQLSGHRIGVIGKTPANVTLLNVILQQYGVDPKKVELVQFATTELADAARDDKIDAFIAAGPINSKITSEAITTTSRDGVPKFLAIDSAAAIAQNHPVYEASEIPAGTFGGSPDRPDADIKTISFAHHIVARKTLSDATVDAFTRQLFAARQSIVAEFPRAAKIETPDTDKDAVLPVHPGAAAYVDGEEKTFLDRYSDYIWWSLMSLSAMGSLGAWFASYMKRDERQANTSQRDRLLDMLAVARHSDSPEQLDQMQAEADSILRDALNCFESGAIEEATLTAFNIALEQFHNAVADRKALIPLMPQTPAVRSARAHVA
ncbi:TAXI family TRAP transporter solute-binding subunit [soil metagenome]